VAKVLVQPRAAAALPLQVVVVVVVREDLQVV
jgi:hypothetical protein